MLKSSLIAAAIVGLPMQAFEPARLQNGTLAPVEIMTASAGMVLVELTVDARGQVRDTRAIKDVAPFTGLVRDSVGGWRFNPARVDRVNAESRVLVIGLFRPPAMLFPVPQVPKAPPPRRRGRDPFSNGDRRPALSSEQHGKCQRARRSGSA
jgi:hypothetical protein